MTRTFSPRFLASVTTSAALLYPLAGLPSQTANNSSARSSMRRLATMCDSEVDSTKSNL